MASRMLRWLPMGLLAAAGLATHHSADAQTFNLGMKALVLSTDHDMALLPSTALQSYGIDFDLVSFVTEQNLYDQNNQLIDINRCVRVCSAP